MRKNLKRGLSGILVLAFILMLLPTLSLTALADGPTDDWDDDTDYYSEPSVSDSTYTVTSAAELAWVAAQVNSGATTFSGYTIELNDNINLSAHFWVPIGDGSHSFGGTFDGSGNTISGLSIGTESAGDDTYNYVGLFGSISGATIENVSVYASIYSQKNITATNIYIGGIVGYINSGTVEACNVAGTLSSTGNGPYIGGLVGYSNTSGVIADSSTSATVTANLAYAAGGIGGDIVGTTISNSYSTGTVTGGYMYTGGLVGLYVPLVQGNSIEGCYATGGVTGESYVGGLIGGLNNTYTSTISSCYATGAVAGETNVGGLIGLCETGSITNCYATGAVSGGATTDGGLVGSCACSRYDIEIINCYAAGSVTGETGSYTGGLVGAISNATTSSSKTVALTVSNCYAAGAVSTGADMGGVIGCSDHTGTGTLNVEISYCYWDNTTSGASYGIGSDDSDTTSTVSMSTSDMQETDFVDTLNANAVELLFDNDSLALKGWNAVASDYPVLNGVGNSEEKIAPIVANVVVSGTAMQGSTLTATYDFADLNGETDASTYRWYRAEDDAGANAAEIDGATDSTYTLTSDDVGYYICVEIMPYDGTEYGDAATSVYTPQVEASAYWTDYAAAEFDGGTGTTDDPYEINTAAQLAYLAKLVQDCATDEINNAGEGYSNLCYEVTGEIDLSDHSWVPVGTMGNFFAGVFNGNGYDISGLKIGSLENPETDYIAVGLFGSVSGTIRNVSVQAEIYSASIYAGGLIGYADAEEAPVTVSGCSAAGSVSAEENGTSAGGLIGYAYAEEAPVTVSGCSAAVSASTTGNGARVGGLIGSADTDDENIVITNCFATGSVCADGMGVCAGGFTGYAAGEDYHTAFYNCCATGDVSLSDGSMAYTTGGFIGYETQSWFLNDYAAGSVGGSTAYGSYAGGFAGRSNTSSAVFTDVYWNSDGAETGIGLSSDDSIQTTGMSSDDMQASSFADTLSANAAVLMAADSSLSLNEWEISAESVYPLPAPADTGSDNNSGSGTGSSSDSGGSGTNYTSIATADGYSIRGVLSEDEGGASFRIYRSSFDKMAQNSSGSVTIDLGVGEITLSPDAVDAISGVSGTGSVNLEMQAADMSRFPKSTLEKIGDRPVYDFTLTVGDTQISQLGGRARIRIPYTLGDGENPNAVVIYYIDDSGELNVVRGHYNGETETVEFTVTHFSVYAVGYNEVSFDDVSDTGWYYDAVTFCAAREITSGTGDGLFSPDATLTRGQFIVMLMRAYGVEADDNATDNFDDAGDTYYTGYLAAAKDLGISNGVGDNLFAPDREITRQDMFTLLYRALDVLDELPETEGAAASLSDFSDAGTISGYAETAMETFVAAGVVSGNDGNLDPLGSSTRAQMAQVLYNLLSL